MSPLKKRSDFVDVPLDEGKGSTEDGETEKEEDLPQKIMSWGCQNFDVLAKRTRERIHRLFYDWGCILQRHHFAVFFIGMLLLVLPCCGVKYLRVETDMEKLLIESEGRLHDEVKFTKEKYGLNGFGEQEFGYETIIQTVQDDEENILTKNGMKEHLDLLKKVMDLEVETTIEGTTKKWGVRDFCFKHDVPFFQARADVAWLIRRLSPCYIMTPLDCFFEGAYIAAHPDTLNITEFNYVTKTPNEIMDTLRGYGPLYVDTVGVEKFMKKTGTDTGYQIKSCLNPTDVNCKSKNEQNLDIGEQLTGGCQGIARNYMRWPEEVIVSGVEKNESGFIKRAKALQSVIAILQPASFAKYANRDKTSAIANFTHVHAKQILDTWKNEFIKLVNDEGKKRGSTTKMMAFSTVSFQHLIDQQTMFQKGSSAFGAILIVFYAIVTLKRWSNAIHSYGSMGLIGVILVSLSVTNGLGLSYFLRMPLSALSTQVLPYLAVGLGLDNMFLLVRTYVFVCDSGKFTDKQIVGMCLGECGLSITITSFANTCAFFMASIIPIVTLQDFARQASIIVAVNWFSVIFVLPAILSFDVERQKDKRYDLWCCFKQNEAETDDNVKRRSNVKKNLNMNFSGNNTLDLPFSLQNTPVNTEQPSNKSNGSQTPHKFVLDRSRRQFNVKPPPAVPPDESQEPSLCSSIIQKVSLTYFAQNYYGRWLCCVQVKIVVLFLCCIQLFLAAYGSTKVKKGLNLVDIVPRNTPAHDFMSARKKYFSYYNFHMVTKFEEDGKEFDYSTLNNQKILLEFDRRIRKVKNVLDVKDKNESGIWLSIYSKWLKEAEQIFLREWKLKKISHRCVDSGRCETKHIEAELIYLLLSTNQNDDFIKRKKFNATLVNEEGLVNPRLFYYGLTLWYWYDNLGTAKSEIGMRPEPLRPRVSIHAEDLRFMKEEFMAAPEIMLIPYAAHNLVTDEDYINLIKDIRSVCDEFHRKYNLPTFPKGIPFTYWEQFIFLERYLVLAGGVVLASTGVFILITFMSLRAAVMVVFFLVVTVFEVYGCLGLFHIELSAISAVTLIMSVGVAFEFTVHIVLAFINTPGDRNNRMRGALEITFAPMIDSAMSTIIMITLLSTSQFDFVVKYFFTLILCLMCIALINGVLVLPVVLSFFGPCCEVTNRSVGPTMNPVFCIPITIDISAHFHHEHNWRNVTDLSTIPEVSERSSPTIKTVDDDHASTIASKSSRPLTPFFPTTTLVQEQSEYQHNNDIDIEKATFKNKSDKPAWHHTPQLHKNENGEYTNERSGRYCYASRKKKHNVRQFPPCNTRSHTNSNHHVGRTSQTVRSMNTSENLKNFNSSNMINENSDLNYNNNNGGDINYIANNSDKYNNNMKNINNQIINNNNNNRNNNDNNIYSNNNSNNTIILHNNKNNNNINLNNNNINTNNTRINNNQPRVIRVQPRDDSSSNTSRCSTKLKATLSIELETSHPYGVTSSTRHDGYEDGGMTRVDF